MHIYLIEVLWDMGAFMRKGRLEEKVKPEHFYFRFDEAWKVMEKHQKTKGYELRVVNWGKQSWLCLQIPLGAPPSWKIRTFLSSTYREGSSHTRVLCPFSGKNRKVRECFLHLPFLKFLQLKVVNMPRCHILR